MDSLLHFASVASNLDELVDPSSDDKDTCLKHSGDSLLHFASVASNLDELDDPSSDDKDTCLKHSGNDDIVCTSPRKLDRSTTKRSFPERLMGALSSADENGVSVAISWILNGSAFVVINPKSLIEEVLPRFFKEISLRGFIDKLKCWGFKKVKNGPDSGAFYHDLFQRDRPRLCLKMRHQRTRRVVDEPKEMKFRISSTCPRNKIVASSVVSPVSPIISKENGLCQQSFSMERNITSKVIKAAIGAAKRSGMISPGMMPIEILHHNFTKYCHLRKKTIMSAHGNHLTTRIPSPLYGTSKNARTSEILKAAIDVAYRAGMIDVSDQAKCR